MSFVNETAKQASLDPALYEYAKSAVGGLKITQAGDEFLERDVKRLGASRFNPSTTAGDYAAGKVALAKKYARRGEQAERGLSIAGSIGTQKNVNETAYTNSRRIGVATGEARVIGALSRGYQQLASAGQERAANEADGEVPALTFKRRNGLRGVR